MVVSEVLSKVSEARYKAAGESVLVYGVCLVTGIFSVAYVSNLILKLFGVVYMYVRDCKNSSRRYAQGMMCVKSDGRPLIAAYFTTVMSNGD